MRLLSFRIVFLALLVSVPVTGSVLAATRVKLLAIFENKVIVKINGQRTVLEKDKPGPEGVVLRFSDTRRESAEIEVDGKLQEFPLAYVLRRGGGETPFDGKDRVRLYSDKSGFFHADGYINNKPVRFLVDTGANTIALNSATARQIGLDYRKGERGVSVTASGYAETFFVTLEKVEVGDLELRNVAAGVIEGPQPDTPLLGMSFLGKFNMKRENNTMDLVER